MPQEMLFCKRCGAAIDEERLHLYRAAGGADGGEPLCADCAALLAPAGAPPPEPAPVAPALEGDESPEEAPSSPGPSPAPPARPTPEVLEEILREVKQIARNQEYEEFSIWNVFGGLVQCVVLFLLFWHYYRGVPDLMWALVLQALALTLFVLAKK